MQVLIAYLHLKLIWRGFVRQAKVLAGKSPRGEKVLVPFCYIVKKFKKLKHHKQIKKYAKRKIHVHTFPRMTISPK